MDLNLTEEQMKIRDQVISQINGNLCFTEGNSSDRSKPITVGGYAGTGKTHLICGIAQQIKKDKGIRFSVGFCAFTGKASAVLKERLNDSDVYTIFDSVSTIHGLMYKPKYAINTKGKKVLCGWEPKAELEVNLIIIDEASMVNKEILSDLQHYGIPIIAVGDHGQLPPIGDKSSLLINPQYQLKQIQRQAEGNPIISLSASVRKHGSITPGIYSRKEGARVYKMNWENPITQKVFNNIEWTKEHIILCGFNATRVKLNNLIREKRKITRPEPYPDERVICLKNNHDTKVMNGQLGTLVWMTKPEPNIYDMTINMDGTGAFYESLVHNCCFGKETYDDGYEQISWKKNKAVLKRTGYKSIDIFDFGYAISVHRSQGSEWDNVVLFEQRSKHWDYDFYKKWLYTAITRAKKNLFIIYNYNNW